MISSVDGLVDVLFQLLTGTNALQKKLFFNDKKLSLKLRNLSLKVLVTIIFATCINDLGLWLK